MEQQRKSFVSDCQVFIVDSTKHGFKIAKSGKDTLTNERVLRAKETV